MPKILYSLYLPSDQVRRIDLGDGEVIFAVTLFCPDSDSRTVTLKDLRPSPCTDTDMYFVLIGEALMTRTVLVQKGNRYLPMTYTNGDLVAFNTPGDPRYAGPQTLVNKGPENNSPAR